MENSKGQRVELKLSPGVYGTLTGREIRTSQNQYVQVDFGAGTFQLNGIHYVPVDQVKLVN